MFTTTNLVALAGDWHGNYPWARNVIEFLAGKTNTVLHLGDFGLWPGSSGKLYIMKMEEACAATGITILVTPGNHEDWSRLEGEMARKPEDRGDGLGEVVWVSDHIAFLPRGHRFDIGNKDVQRSVVSLGGAPSIDFENRVIGKSWWPVEQISQELAEKVASEGYADIMLTHDSPNHPYWTSAVASICEGGGGWSWSDKALAYAAVGRERMHIAFEGVQPRVFAHGHYHVYSTRVAESKNEVGETLMLSLNADGAHGNVLMLDLESLLPV